ncbi:MAG: BamA/TamA family outer membrane protein [Bacteroidales bacterium]|nr:BamA/TamA family outer membrane protein [Bacteroidales bacterium]
MSRFWYLFFIISFGVGLSALTSCYPTRNVPENQHLLVKNKYKIVNGKIKQHSISSYIIQKPNKKIIFYRFYLNAYNFGTWFTDSTWLNRLFTQSIGEPPVIYDSNLVIASGINIKKHLNNLGYYNSSVSAEIKTWPVLNIAKIKYIVDAGKPYTIRKIDYDIPENNLRRFVQADLSNSVLKPGMNFKVEHLEQERERIVSALNNSGYYYFIRNQISYEADTNLNSHEVDLRMKILPLQSRISTTDSVVYIPDKQFIIEKIYIAYDLLRSDKDMADLDTNLVTVTERKGRIVEYYFLSNGEMAVNPKAIINSLFVKSSGYYKKRDIVESYKALTALNMFRYINIELIDVSDSASRNGSLDCYVTLLPSKKYSFTSNSEVKNTGGDFGLQQNIGLRTLNTFRYAETMTVDLHGAMEMQSSSNVDTKTKWPFNVYEAGINAAIDFPRFISPFKIFKGNRYLRPKTRMTIGYNYQKRTDYTRYILHSSFGYTWQPKPRYYNNFRLLEVSSVKIFPSDEFQKIIDSYTDPRIRYSYQDHLVLSSNYSFTYNEHRFKGLKPFTFFFAAMDIGGFPWNLGPRLFQNQRDSVGQIILFGLPSAEYVKLEADGRYYVPAGRNTMNVFRAFVGIGLPYGKSKALPFEKSFYIGGANSLRGWIIGTLGPGAFNSNATTFEMTGDIKLEFNYEFRFSLSGNLEGAFFTDVGNIWLINKSDVQPDGHFTFGSFIPQFAIDFGYGLRYDLEFLVIRIDLAHPIYQPYFPSGSRWTATSTQGNLLTSFNFAIGYPF